MLPHLFWCTGETEFCVNVTDGISNTTVCVRIKVVPPASSVAIDDTYMCYSGVVCIVPPGEGLLANDTVPILRNLTIISTTNATGGTVVINPDGSFTWTPPTE